MQQQNIVTTKAPHIFQHFLKPNITTHHTIINNSDTHLSVIQCGVCLWEREKEERFLPCGAQKGGFFCLIWAFLLRTTKSNNIRSKRSPRIFGNMKMNINNKYGNIYLLVFIVTCANQKKNCKKMQKKKCKKKKLKNSVVIVTHSPSRNNNPTNNTATTTNSP